MTIGQDLTRYEHMVPEGNMVVFGVMIAGFVNEDGEICGSWHLDGETDKAVIVGHMEIAKQHIIQSSWTDPEGED